jgi:hypothetical protein
MDSSVSPKDEIWSLRVCHHISTGLYNHFTECCWNVADIRNNIKAGAYPLCRGYTGCPGRNVKNFGRVFLMLKYTDITQNTYIQSWTVTPEKFQTLTAVTHLLITKFILKLAGIGGLRLYWADIRLWGTQGPFIRPRCIGTVRARTHCKSNQAYTNNAMLPNLNVSARGSTPMLIMKPL